MALCCYDFKILNWISLIYLQLIRRFLAIFAGHNVGAITVGLSDFLKDTLGIYDKLSENAKQDLMREFPTISDLLTSQ